MKAALAVGGIAAVASAISLRAWAEGFQYGGNSPFLVLSMAVAVVVTYLAAQRRRSLLAVAAALMLYLVSTAVAVELAGLRGQRDPFAVVAVIVHACGYILPVALLQAAFIAAGERLGVVRRRGRLLARWVVGYAAVYWIVAALAVPVGVPYEDIQPLLDLGEDWSWALALPWMLGVLAGPVVMWRAVRRARGEPRARALVVAVLSLAPIVTIVFCVLAGFMAFDFGLLSVEFGEWALAIAFSLPFVVCAPGLLHALGSAQPSPSERWMRVLATFVALPLGIVVVAVSSIVGSRFGSVLPIVVATLAVAGAIAVVRRRLVRFLVLWADPVRARTARLVREHDGSLRPAAGVEAILRQSLGEPELTLLLRLPEGRGWVTVDGTACDEPGTAFGDSARLTGLTEDGDLPGCLAEVAPLIDRAVLEVAVRDQAARVEEAVSGERRRLERDLHDGVQGRLLALALDLKMAEHTVGGEARLLLNDAAESLGAAIGELRSLAGGDMPELLSRRGLKAALADLTGRMPVPISLAVTDFRLPAQQETIAYLVVCEAVTNALKHARADSIDVEVVVEAGRATVTVRDDGCGGADLRAGTGLRGLAERVRSAGGHLMVSDARPRGTVLEVTLPCES
ncbi:sensor histidine kinase [Nonomuraea soli]|uniref:histidine kinase n=1 Tax=Nonomuraea soli TaxID=1032476 RepID=A0A7W0CKC3_9ACTN|nr:ATP-binding protein [Nonomuraea soli]MBA2892774.1 signal transduction histidine kinase [Nonomuraea soli]